MYVQVVVARSQRVQYARGALPLTVLRTFRMCVRANQSFRHRAVYTLPSYLCWFAFSCFTSSSQVVMGIMRYHEIRCPLKNARIHAAKTKLVRVVHDPCRRCCSSHGPRLCFEIGRRLQMGHKDAPHPPGVCGGTAASLCA